MFNKADILDAGFAREWMTNLEAFQDAVAADNTYASSLSRSLALVLDAFYSHLKTVEVSALAGYNMDGMVEVGPWIITATKGGKPKSAPLFGNLLDLCGSGSGLAALIYFCGSYSGLLVYLIWARKGLV